MNLGFKQLFMVGVTIPFSARMRNGGRANAVETRLVHEVAPQSLILGLNADLLGEVISWGA